MEDLAMEETSHSQELLWQKIARRGRSLLQTYKVPFFTAVLAGLLCFTYFMTNKLPNHDDVFTTFFKGGTWSLGRWGLGALDLIFPNYSMPWINGLLTIVLMAAAVCVIVHIFSIRNTLIQGLLAGCVVAFPSLTATLCYMFTAAPYALSFLLAVSAVLLLRQERKWEHLLALAVTIASLSIYQSYIAVVAGLLILTLVKDLLDGKDNGKVLRRGIYDLVFLAAALGIYYGLTMVLNRLRGISFNGYASGNLSFDFVSIPADILLAYRSFFRFFTQGFRGLMPTPASRLFHALMLLGTLVLIVCQCLTLEKKDAGRFLLLAVLLGLLPLAINCMYLFTVEDAVHTLVLYGFVALYVLAAFVCDGSLARGGWLRRWLLHGLTLVMALILAGNIYFANEVSLNLFLRYENACSFYTSLTAQIKSMPEFGEDTKLAILGTYQEPAFYEEQFGFLSEVTGVKGFLPDSYSRERFLEYYMGFPIPAPSEEETAEILVSPEYAEMRCYPYYGSVRLIGDTIVVKLSDVS